MLWSLWSQDFWIQEALWVTARYVALVRDAFFLCCMVSKGFNTLIVRQTIFVDQSWPYLGPTVIFKGPLFGCCWIACVIHVGSTTATAPPLGRETECRHDHHNEQATTWFSHVFPSWVLSGLSFGQRAKHRDIIDYGTMSHTCLMRRVVL